MTGEGNHRYCQNAVSIQPCTITGTIYDTGWGFPAFRPEGSNTVHAELIEIPIDDWPAMDRLEGYPRLYDRMLVPAMLEDGSTVEAWVYVMNIIPPQAKVIPSGSWKHREDDRQRCPRQERTGKKCDREHAASKKKHPKEMK
jgi:gamma-glutamylcyclotransferase (GGCT)/AIG2-like uncharacterized protein YtfP